MSERTVEDRIVFGNTHRAMLVEELMLASARFVQENYADRSEFILARQLDRDEYEPWFEICLPDGTHLRVTVELRAL